ncbi:unnamed protein product [Moneuplotes crassus]|uniref:Exocyst complex component EXOC6/Sec15 N-terminal domain-containing protein n=1 Tax=Euplotes crassus TaxID=5936 RepID=A0AAD2CWM8_EUPCR|nr:unnamed protein product [Moneuplotes crassus]
MNKNFNTVGKYDEKFVEDCLDDIRNGGIEEIVCSSREIINDNLNNNAIEGLQDKIQKRIANVDQKIQVLCKEKASDHFLKSMEVFEALKNNIFRLRESVTQLDFSLLKVDEGISKNSEDILTLKTKFKNALGTMHKLKLVKECFSILEKLEKFVEMGNIYQGYELLFKLKAILDEKLSEYIPADMDEFFRSKIRTLEILIKNSLDSQLMDWIEDLQNEQERIGSHMKGMAESKLAQPSKKEKKIDINNTFRDTYKVGFTTLLTKKTSSYDSESSENFVNKTLRDMRGNTRGSIYFSDK